MFFKVHVLKINEPRCLIFLLYLINSTLMHEEDSFTSHCAASTNFIFEDVQREKSSKTSIFEQDC